MPTQDVTEIAAPVAYEPIPVSAKSDNIVFDLETTGLGDNPEIVQLATSGLGRAIAVYIVPSCSIQR